MLYRSVLGGLALAALVAGTAGCKDKNSLSTSGTVTVDNGQRVKVIGRIVDGNTRQPISGATVEVCGIGSGTSDGNGMVSFDVHSGNFNAFATDSSSFREGAGRQTTLFGVKISHPQYATIVLSSVNFFNDESGNDTTVVNQDNDVFERDSTTIQNGVSISGEIDPGANTTVVVNLSEQTLTRGVDVTVVLTKDGDPLDGASVSLFRNNFGEGLGGVFTECTEEMTATTNGNGVATFSNVDPGHGDDNNGGPEEQRYTIYVPPQDINRDGFYDFEADDTAFRVRLDGTTVALDLQSERLNDPGVQIAAVNLKHFPNFERWQNNSNNDQDTTQLLAGVVGDFTGFDTDFSDDDLEFREDGTTVHYDYSGASEFVVSQDVNVNVRITFRTPVDILTADGGTRDSGFEFEPLMVSPTLEDGDVNPSFNRRRVIALTASPLAGTNGTIWDLRPASRIDFYELFNVHFSARSRLGSNTPIRAMRTSGLIHIQSFGRNSSSSFNPTLDNYNGSQDGSGESDTVFLEFNRLVIGAVRVTRVVADNEVVFGSLDTDFANEESNGTTFSVVTKQVASVVRNLSTAPREGTTGSLGATEGFRFRFPLEAFVNSNGFRVELNDDVETRDVETTFRNNATVEFNVEDIDGNHLFGVHTLNVD